MIKTIFQHQSPLPTVSIAIPAHNEAQNLPVLIESIMAQRQRTFALEHIFINCDGSTDETPHVASHLSEQYPGIIVLYDGARRGKAARLQEMYQANGSDILVAFDADIRLSSNFHIENLIRPLLRGEAVLSAGSKLPAKAESLFEELVNVWFYFWSYARAGYRAGRTIHNVSGCNLAMTGSFAKTVTFPPGTITESRYLYLFARKSGHEVAFAPAAVIYYRSPSTMDDYLSQISRARNEKQWLAAHFGTWIYEQFQIPPVYKYRAALRALSRHHVFFVASAAMHIMIPRLKKGRKPASNGIWASVRSTKRVMMSILPGISLDRIITSHSHLIHRVISVIPKH